MSGKYFYIQSKMNQLVLDIDGGGSAEGTRIITWEKKHGDCDNQLWYEDGFTGTIRSKLNDMCLSTNDDNMAVIYNYQPGNSNQLWQSSGDRISNRENSDRVIDISGANSDPGAEVIVWDYNGGDNQHWEFDIVPPRYFMIRSEMNNKVLDIEGGNDGAGANAILWHPNDELSANQLWYEDRWGNIRSKLNDFVLDSSGGNFSMQPYTSQDDQFWSIQGNKICRRSNPDRVMDIEGENDDDGATVCEWDYKGSSNQHWNFEYV
eukprot:GHVU01152133.1.p1 GENE.GHVU01152133.1~~GHVU01152133.1.p1  ORF type:complete len:263 (-),score=55.59 GHVU01152133.1:820-1608(-)